MPLTELAAPASLAVNLQDLKNNLRLTTSDEDGLVALYAEAAVNLFEEMTSQRLISRSFRWDQRDFPMESDEEGIELPVAPVASITHVKYYDTAGVLTTWASDNYTLDSSRHFPRVHLAPSITYPTVQDDRHNGVQITFSAGYGATYASVPKGIQWAIIVLASHMFVNRTPVIVGAGASELPMHLQNAIGVYKLRRA